MDREIEEQIQKLKHSKNLPEHVAIIMDGNGRWAKKRTLPRLTGHRAGRESVKCAVRTCAKIGIDFLTLYAFSIENWQRPKAEVKGLMSFFEKVLKEEHDELNENGVQLRAIGRLDMLPDSTKKILDEAIKKLSHNSRLVLTLAISYGARAEIVDAVKRIAAGIEAGKINSADINDALIGKNLYEPDIPDPDLLIRTSGEMRISNFLLWQIAYSEIYVTDTLWPDFREKDLIDGIVSFQGRERRFGQIT